MTKHPENHQTSGHNGLNKSQEVAVVIVPFPAQGHLNQLLHLSRLISSYNIPVHYVSSATHSRQAKLRVHGWDPIISAPNIRFHEFPTPSFPTPPPDPNSPTKFPAHLQPSFDATSHLRDPVASLLRSLSPTSRRIIIIHDTLMSSAVKDSASLPNAESYVFHSVSAFTTFLYFWEAKGMPLSNLDRGRIPQHLPSLEGCFTEEFEKFIASQIEDMELASGHLYNTSRVMEAPYLDLMADKKIWAVGPFNPVKFSHRAEETLFRRHPCLQWLDEQRPNSVVYVSFGTTTSFTDEQICELAVGLERSGKKFIWVLRDADKGDVFEEGEVRRAELPEGYEERVLIKEKGMVVRDWAPQLEILAHEATGGFVSHCGWNSCMESITMGVPIAAWPMHSDQPRNAVLVADLLRVGCVLKEWGRRDELVTAEVVEGVVRKLMDSEEGEEMRRRAAELGGAMRGSAAKGGVSHVELESFVAYITRENMN